MDLDEILAEMNRDIDNQLNSFTSDNLGVDIPPVTAPQGNESDRNNDSLVAFCPECGTRLEGATRFCPNCGAKIATTENNSDMTAPDYDEEDEDWDEDEEEWDEDEEDEDEEDEENADRSDASFAVQTDLAIQARQADGSLHDEDPLQEMHGIILTNTAILAKKYGCARLLVKRTINDFIDQSEKQLMHWSLLDVADEKDGIEDSGSWADYNSLLDRFIKMKGLTIGADLHLFIIGGNDVVPVPMLKNPYHGEDVPCDFAYSFVGKFLADYLDGKTKDISVKNARNTVGRLPLEDGKMPTKIGDDLTAYFNISGMYAGGIPVGSVVMSSNVDWIPASVTMSEHLPLVFEAAEADLVRNGMYISPKLMTSDEETVKVYSHSLADADMLMFNLHGSDREGQSGFYSYGEAFNPSLLAASNARVFNTVACYGARYREYKRDDSMLLSALYGGGVLLYTGSMVSVPMCQQSQAQQMLLNPGTGSEVLMRLYPLYQFRGLPAGRALLEAKLDYFNLCRHVESDSFSFATIMMFSLYGNPMLHVRQRRHVIASALENDSIPPAPVKSSGQPLCKDVRKTIVKGNQGKPMSILELTRAAVDANLTAIRAIVEHNLYRELGLPPRDLTGIDSVKRKRANGTSDDVYSFNYHDSKAMFGADKYVEVDKRGNILRVFSTK